MNNQEKLEQQRLNARRDFLKKATFLGGGLFFIENGIVNALTPVPVYMDRGPSTPPIFFGWIVRGLVRLAGHFLFAVASNIAASAFIDGISSSNVRREVHHYHNKCSCTADQSLIMHSQNQKQFACAIRAGNGQKDNYSNVYVPFYSDELNNGGMTADLNMAALSGVSQAASKLGENNDVETTSKILLPKKITAKTISAKSDMEGGVYVYHTDTAKVAVTYNLQHEATVGKGGIEIIPNELNRFSFDDTKRKHQFDFDIESIA